MASYVCEDCGEYIEKALEFVPEEDENENENEGENGQTPEEDKTPENDKTNDSTSNKKPSSSKNNKKDKDDEEEEESSGCFGSISASAGLFVMACLGMAYVPFKKRK